MNENFNSSLFFCYIIKSGYNYNKLVTYKVEASFMGVSVSFLSLNVVFIKFFFRSCGLCIPI